MQYNTSIYMRYNATLDIMKQFREIKVQYTVHSTIINKFHVSTVRLFKLIWRFEMSVYYYYYYYY